MSDLNENRFLRLGILKRVLDHFSKEHLNKLKDIYIKIPSFKILKSSRKLLQISEN